MRWTYACPHCQAMLNPDETVVLIGECGPHRILIGFHPEPGNYRAYLPPEFNLQEGSMWEFSCPVCSRDLRTDFAPELCALDMAAQALTFPGVEMALPFPQNPFVHCLDYG